MAKDPGDILLRRYLEGSCTRAEQEQIESWMEEDPSHADRIEQFAMRNANEVDIEKKRVKSKIFKRIGIESAGITKQSDTATPKAGNSRSKFKTQWFVAASVVLIALTASVGVYMWQNRTFEQEVVYKEREMPAGKTVTLTLSDGSKVHLNSESTLKFPKQFGTEVREIYLKGEAFFEVTPDRDRPFKVHAGNLKTTVLGTAFNVKSFSSEQQVQITVEHGKVSVEKEQADSPSNAMMLTDNEWATFDKKNQTLKKGSGDIRQFTAWRNGILYLHNKTVKNIAATLERWYGTDITIKNEAIKDCVLHGEYKEESLENVLKAMQFALGMNYSFTEKGIFITGGQCK